MINWHHYPISLKYNSATSRKAICTRLMPPASGHRATSRRAVLSFYHGSDEDRDNQSDYPIPTGRSISRRSHPCKGQGAMTGPAGAAGWTGSRRPWAGGGTPAASAEPGCEFPCQGPVGPADTLRGLGPWPLGSRPGLPAPQPPAAGLPRCGSAPGQADLPAAHPPWPLPVWREFIKECGGAPFVG